MGSHRFALAGRTALVTGAGKRIGRAVALALAEAGAGVVVHYGRSSREAEQTAEAIREKGVEAWTLQADLSDPAEAEGLFARAVEAAGPIELLVNGASIFPTSQLATFSVEELSRNMQINAMAPLQIGRAFAAQGREGAIVNFLDSRIMDYDEEHAAYHVSKRALFTLTRMMAREFAPTIRVNAVAPGLILPPDDKPEGFFERLADTNLLERVGTVGGVVDAVLFLLRAAFVTGEVLFVDGGRRLRGSMYGC